MERTSKTTPKAATETASQSGARASNAGRVLSARGEADGGVASATDGGGVTETWDHGASGSVEGAAGMIGGMGGGGVGHGAQ